MKREAQEGLSTPSPFTSHASPQCWAVIPAAGSGARMAAAVPKQYLPLRGRTVLEQTLLRITGHPRIVGTVVVLAADDPHWPQIAGGFADQQLWITRGGAERAHSVLNGLLALKERAAPRDWVLVHDAARPCVRSEDIDALLEQLRDHPVGGLLGIPVTDTKKRIDGQGNIIETVERVDLWRALTPQMFRYQLLLEALQAALARHQPITDEAAAMEQAGHTPRMVKGHAGNIKITRPQDLALAAWYLSQQEAE